MDGGWIATFLDPLEGSLADDAIARPATEFGSNDHLRANPAGLAQLTAPPAAVVARGWWLEGRIVDFE
jgi:hypothetical protein